MLLCYFLKERIIIKSKGQPIKMSTDFLYYTTLPSPVLNNVVVNQVHTLDPNMLGLISSTALSYLATKINPETTHLVKFRLPATANVFDRLTNQIEVVEIIPFDEVGSHITDCYFYTSICRNNENNKRWLADTSIEQLRQSAFQLYSDMILFVDNPTDKDFEYALTQNKHAVKHISPEKLTFDLVKLVLKDNAFVFHEIPKAIRTPEIIKYAIEVNEAYTCFNVMKHIDEDEKTQEICDMAVQKYVYIFSHIPKKCMTPELVDFALGKDPLLIQYVPEALQTRNRVLDVLKRQPEAIRFVHRQTQEMADTVAFRSAKAMQYVRKEFYTPAMCLHALQKYNWSFKFVKERNQIPDVCVAGVTRFRKALRRVVHQTLEICLAAVTQDGMKLKFVRQQTPEICETAVRQCKEAIRYVRKEFKTAELMKLVN